MQLQIDGIREPLARQLSAFGLWLLIANGMIGAGIFGLPAQAARLSGSFSPWVFVICGLLMFPIVLCFAELAAHFKTTGGPVLYCSAAFGPLVGFQAGWALYIGRATAFAANVNILVNTLEFFWPAASDKVLHTILIFLICFGLAVVNLKRIRGAITLLGVLTVLKILPLLTLIGVGLAHMRHIPSAVDAASTHDFGAAILLVAYAYMGFEMGPVAAGEARNPKRDIPRALLLALLVCCLLYGLIQMISIATLPSLESSTRPLVDVGAALLGPGGAALLSAAVIASVGGNLSSSMFTVPRITYRLALDGTLPAFFGIASAVNQTPIFSILFFAALCFLLAAWGGFVWLAGLSVLVRVPMYLCCIVAIPRIRKMSARLPHREGAGREMILPIIAAAECLALLTQVKGQAYVAAIGFLLVGSVLYAASRYWKTVSPPQQN